jgi:outer membrane immunogenic protein
MKAYLAGVAMAGGALMGAVAHAQPAANDWSGAYVGVNGGWNWAKVRSSSDVTVNQLSGVNAGAGPVSVPSTTFPGNANRTSRNRFIGGGQVGFNVQSGPLVWGLEADLDGVNSGRSQAADVYRLGATGVTTDGTATVQSVMEPKWMASVRGRVGAGVGPALLYGTGGVAFVNFRDRGSYTYAPTTTAGVAAANPGVSYGPYSNFASSGHTRTGWTVGAGAEMMAATNLVLGVEYRHTEVGRHMDDFSTAAANSVGEVRRSRFRDDAVFARASLKFSGLGGIF